MSERVVETEFVFDRLQAAELSAAYRILVPERPSRSVRAGQEASRADEQRSDLCPGLLGPAAPCRRIPPNTRSDVPCNGWRTRVTFTAAGRSLRPVVSRGFVFGDSA